MNDSTFNLHKAVCNAVEILNVSPEVVVLPNGREIYNILRNSLAVFAEEYMNETPKTTEIKTINRKYNK